MKKETPLPDGGRRRQLLDLFAGWPAPIPAILECLEEAVLKYLLPENGNFDQRFNPAPKNQRDLIRLTHIEMIPNHSFKPHPARLRPVGSQRSPENFFRCNQNMVLAPES